MLPQEYGSNLESRAPFVFQDIKAYPSELHKQNQFYKRQEVLIQTATLVGAGKAYLVDVGMIYFGEKTNLLQGKYIKTKIIKSRY